MPTRPHSDGLMCGLTLFEHRAMCGDQQDGGVVREVEVGAGHRLVCLPSIRVDVIQCVVAPSRYGNMLLKMW